MAVKSGLRRTIFIHAGVQLALAIFVEINNNGNTLNNEPINIIVDREAEVIQKPQVKEIVIPRPIAEGKSRPKPIAEKPKAVFEF